MSKKEKDTGYTSYWQHKRPYGKRVVAKRNRKNAKRFVNEKENQN